jgi:putative flippase GtrA
MDAGLLQEHNTPMLKKDIIISAIIGFLVAILILPIIKQSGFKFPFAYALTMLLTFPILSVLSMRLASVIGQKIEFIYQAAKFILVGTLNTFVDWGMLNLLLIAAAISSGPLYPVCKGASFVVAATNSYFWNKFWTFKKTQEPNGIVKSKSNSAEVFEFSLVSLIGFALNVSVANFIVNIWGPHFHVSTKPWATAGALGGTLVGLVWNFIGYKLVVFSELNWMKNKTLKMTGLFCFLTFLISLLFSVLTFYLGHRIGFQFAVVTLMSRVVAILLAIFCTILSLIKLRTLDKVDGVLFVGSLLILVLAFSFFIKGSY